MSKNPQKYGITGFLFDAVMFCVTGGLWLIRIYVRESRRRNHR
jgi:hypothetical protein